MISEFLKKAQENLMAAQLCFERECYNACANRIYYAALQAAVAAIAAEGIKQDKVDHKQAQSDFNGQLIHFGFSVGIAFSHFAENPEDLVMQAAQAMYKAKNLNPHWFLYKPEI